MAELTAAQRRALLVPIQSFRVERNPQGMSYLEGYDIIAHLTRLFGFEGWDKELTGLELLFEDHVKWTTRDNKEKEGWDVAYRASVRLTIRNPSGEIVTVKEDASTGDAQHQPGRSDAHDLAVKAAVTGALKRAAKDLGDQFGLGLYDKGSMEPLVKEVVPYKDPGSVSPQTSGAGTSTPTTPEPLHPSAPGTDEMIDAKQRSRMWAICRQFGWDPHLVAAGALGHACESLNDLTREEADVVIMTLVENERVAKQTK
jgi:hypothetical protein